MPPRRCAPKGEAGAFELRDLYFFRPLAVDKGEAPRGARQADPLDEGYGFELRSEASVRGRKGWQLHGPSAGFADCGGCETDRRGRDCRPPARARGRRGAGQPARGASEFRPALAGAAVAQHGGNRRAGDARLPAGFRAEAGEWLLHPALMDLATGWAMDLIAGYQPDHLWVPVSYGLVRVLRPLPARSSAMWSAQAQTGPRGRRPPSTSHSPRPTARFASKSKLQHPAVGGGPDLWPTRPARVGV